MQWSLSKLALPVLLLVSAGCVSSGPGVSLREVLQHEIGAERRDLPDVRVTMGAHRGASMEFRENTLDAILAADRDPRFAFIEFDVQYTRDGVIVVYHDLMLVRLFGKVRSVGNETLASLRDLTGGEIATYADVMDRVTKRLNIEIKSQGDDREDARLADALIADLRARHRLGDTMISSISGEVIAYIKRTYPEVKTGQIFWLTSSTYLHLDILTEQLFDRFAETRADYLMLHVANLRNIANLLALKPPDKTIVFWDFDDRMYLVHQDPGDRLWGTPPPSRGLRALRSGR
ncbi:MAG TPA: glycerophosphodiester phosphodiesterase family protein [Kiritimatiellia bacterium]|nr:glycerophosphodiester phosphodiesterase family protein [Kiritimatiellia bacterium]HMP33415.1 glycerophosphodiester phosphodiesterase family protein [Kiritimatiellia bacterium]